jgi:hypothetical protein
VSGVGHSKKLLGTLLAVGLAATGFGVVPAGATPPPPPLTGTEDTANMLKYEQLMFDHMRSGHSVEVEFDSPERIEGHVVGTGGWGDSGLWTGV